MKRRAPRLLAPAPRGVPRGYCALFGKRAAERARCIAAFVQAEAVDRFELVEIAVLRCADEYGMSRATAYRYLRAGRWLLNRGGWEWKR